MIDIACGHCGEKLSVPGSQAGQVEICPVCKSPVFVPTIPKPSPPPQVGMILGWTLIPGSPRCSRWLVQLREMLRGRRRRAILVGAVLIAVLGILAWIVFTPRHRGFPARPEIAKLLAENGYHLLDPEPSHAVILGRRLRAFSYCLEASDPRATAITVYIPLQVDHPVVAITTTYGGDDEPGISEHTKRFRSVHAIIAPWVIRQLAGVNPEIVSGGKEDVDGFGSTQLKMIQAVTRAEAQLAEASNFPGIGIDWSSNDNVFITIFRWDLPANGFNLERRSPMTTDPSGKPRHAPTGVIIRDGSWDMPDIADDQGAKRP